MTILPKRLVSVPVASSFLATRIEYIAICNGDTCAAALLDLLESFAVFRRDSGYEDWEWCAFTQQDIVERLHHMYGLSKVKQRLTWLREMGYIETRHNDRYKYDRRTQYRFASDVVQAALNYWAEGDQVVENQPIEALNSTSPLDEFNQSISRIQPLDQSKTTNRLDENDQSDSLESVPRSQSTDRDTETSSSSSTRGHVHATPDDDDDQLTQTAWDQVGPNRSGKVLLFRKLLANPGATRPSPPSSAAPPLRPTRAAAVAAYEADIGRAGATIETDIEQAVLRWGEGAVIEAIKRGAKYGARSWAYVQAMLEGGDETTSAARSYVGGQYAEWMVH